MLWEDCRRAEREGGEGGGWAALSAVIPPAWKAARPRQLHGKGLRGAGWERLAGDSRCPLVAFRVGAAAPPAPPRCEGSERPNSTTRPGLGGRSGVRNTVSVRFHISLR